MNLTFGIPTLDSLLEIPSPRGVRLPGAKQEKLAASSLTVLGPDGSGKSVLALHLASNYRAWCLDQLETGERPPLVLYVSSDLQFDSANKVWENFGLNEPNNRQIPFERMPHAVLRRQYKELVVKLQRIVPSGSNEESEIDFLLKKRGDTEVGFLDLARFTAGDDWNFVNALIVNLEAADRPAATRGAFVGQKLSHLVIIDSVAGFETFVGKLDAFGMEQTRRARIAQCMRNAGAHAHLVFIVEEPDDGKRLPEEYVTDVVMRLRSRREGSRTLRTVEIEKARARNHAIGEHVFEIRPQQGSSTGVWENADTPSSKNAYVHVFHSLSHRNLLIASDRGTGKPQRVQTGVASFGLRYLDRLLDHDQPLEGKDIKASGGEQQAESRRLGWGIRKGSTAAIIGDASTGKSLLAERFMAEGFKEIVEDALAVYFLLAHDLLAEKGFELLEETRKRAEEAFRGVLTRLAEPILEWGGAREKPKEIASIECKAQIGLYTAQQQVDYSDRLLRAWDVGDCASQAMLQEVTKARFPLESPEVEVSRRLEVLKARRPDSWTTEARDAGDISKSRSYRYADFKKVHESLRARDWGRALKRLFRHPNLRRPGILFATGDRNVSVVAEHCLGYLRGNIDRTLRDFLHNTKDDDLRLEVLKPIKEILEEQIIVRRFDIDTVTAPGLFDTVQRNIIEAQYMLHGPYFPPDKIQRHSKADRIRLVVDDLRALSNLCPSVSKESAFLPFLVFFLEREGVTSLFVHTADLRPGPRPEDPISQELLSLLKQVIFTWGVPFEGQNRVAISAIPAGSKDTNGLVREVVVGRNRELGCLTTIVQTGELPSVEVTPKFELYADLEVGRPRLVPLAVYIFSATKAFKAYLDEEDKMFREQFVPILGAHDDESKRVLWPIDVTRYLAIRDLTHIPWEVQADRAIVDQVDSFWSLDAGTGSLASQYAYLMDEPDEHTEPFHLFTGTPLSPDGLGVRAHRYSRKDFFQNSEYVSRIRNFPPPRGINPLMPDRVPFMWDFGFMLVPVGPWERAGETTIKLKGDGDRNKDIPDWWPEHEEDRKVKKVLNELRKNKKKESRKVVPWRLFFGACAEVAEQAGRERGITPVVFDFACTASETLTSLFLEMWFSEITLALAGAKTGDLFSAWSQWLHRLSSATYVPIGREDAGTFSLTALLQPDLTDKFRNFGDLYREEALKWQSSWLQQSVLSEDVLKATVQRCQSGGVSLKRSLGSAR